MSTMDEAAPRQRLPVLAIAGRPNVGKSAIFNRILGRRAAIVHAHSGVTRDRLAAGAAWGDRLFELVDTGGITTLDRERESDPIEAGVRMQTDIAIRDADGVIFVTDAETGILPLDEEVARLLRAGGKRVWLACNKCDSPARDAEATAFERFGFAVFPVSALHDRGFGDLMDTVTAAIPAASYAAAGNPVRVTISGRPNVGKSSLVNRLLGSARVIVSPVAGTTRDSIDIPFSIGSGASTRHYVLTDTAGFRKQGRLDTAIERYSLMRADASIRTSHVVILLLDAVEGPTEQDKHIAARAQAHGRGCVIIVNKWDLAKGVRQKDYEAALKRALPFVDYAPVVFVSALSGYNTGAAVEAIDRVAAQARAQLPTGVLNRTILAAHEKTPPPMVEGKRLKVYYSTQVGVDPVRIALFVNDPRRMVPAYEAYLKRVLRERFTLDGVPLVFEMRARRDGDATSDKGSGRRAAARGVAVKRSRAAAAGARARARRSSR